MQKLLTHVSRNRALHTGAWVVALALFFGVCHLGKKSVSEGQDQQDSATASDNCLKAARDAVAQKAGSLPGTRVSVALASDAGHGLGNGGYSCRAIADVLAPNTDLVARYDLTLTTSNGAFVLTAWRPHR